MSRHVNRLVNLTINWLAFTPYAMTGCAVGGATANSVAQVYTSRQRNETLEEHAVAAGKGAAEGLVMGCAGGFVFWITLPLIPVWAATVVLTKPAGKNTD